MDEQVQALLAAPSTVMVSPRALRWGDEWVSAMTVALTASILSNGWPARFTHNGYEQKCLWIRVGVLDSPWMSVVCLVMLLSGGWMVWLWGIHAPIQGQ